MCISDWRLGIVTTNKITLGAIGLGTPVVVPPNPNRIALVVSPTILFSGTQGFLVTFNSGAAFVVAYASGLLKMSLPENGKVIQEGFSVSMLVGNFSICVTESELPSNYLAVALNEFNSQYAKQLGMAR